MGFAEETYDLSLNATESAGRARSMSFPRSGSLSFCQELLLYTEILERRAPTISRLVRIDGEIDPDAFILAANAVVASHEPLRSVFELQAGETRCRVLPPDEVADCALYVDAKGSTEIISWLRSAYDPAQFAAGRVPQIKHCVVRIERRIHLWALGLHHIAGDAVSMQQYGETFRKAYLGNAPEAQATSSIEHARVEREWFASPDAQAQFNWWLSHLDSMGPQYLPAKSSVASSPGGQQRQELRIGGGRSVVSQRAQEWRVPVAALFLAAFARIVRRLIKSQDVSLLMNVPGRHLHGASSATGAFYNTLPLFIRADPDEARVAASNAAEVLFEALDRQGIPIALLDLGVKRKGGMPIADRIPITFNVVDHPMSSFCPPDCCLHEIDVSTLTHTKWGLNGPTSLQQTGDSSRRKMDWLVTVLPSCVALSVEYDAARYDGKDVRNMLNSFGIELGLFFGTQPASHCDPSLIA